MLKIRPEDRLIVCGLPGQGKTTFLRYLISVHPFTPYIIDPLDQYGEFGEVGDVLQGGNRCIPNMSRARMEIEAISLKLHSISNVVLVVEEAEQFYPQIRPLGDRTASLIQMGRNWNVGVYGTTRRIQDVNKVWFDLGNRVFFFRAGLQSRGYIADKIGADFIYNNRPTKYNANKTGYTLTNLPPYHCMHFDLTNETAEVLCLKLGTRQHIETVGTKSEAGREQVKKIAGAVEKAEEEDHQNEEKIHQNDDVKPVVDPKGGAGAAADEAKLWTPRKRQ